MSGNADMNEPRTTGSSSRTQFVSDKPESAYPQFPPEINRKAQPPNENVEPVSG
jgi:hypothetical protein